jgi:cytochrome c-type biogenesis protein CcmH
LLLKGRSDAEIRSHLVARYGDFILFRPQLNARTAWLWAAPGVLLLIGLVVAVRVVRDRAARADATDDEADLPA